MVHLGSHMRTQLEPVNMCQDPTPLLQRGPDWAWDEEGEGGLSGCPSRTHMIAARAHLEGSDEEAELLSGGMPLGMIVQHPGRPPDEFVCHSPSHVPENHARVLEYHAFTSGASEFAHEQALLGHDLQSAVPDKEGNMQEYPTDSAWDDRGWLPGRLGRMILTTTSHTHFAGTESARGLWGCGAIKHQARIINHGVSKPPDEAAGCQKPEPPEHLAHMARVGQHILGTWLLAHMAGMPDQDGDWGVQPSQTHMDASWAQGDAGQGRHWSFRAGHYPGRPPDEILTGTDSGLPVGGNQLRLDCEHMIRGTQVGWPREVREPPGRPPDANQTTL